MNTRKLITKADRGFAIGDGIVLLVTILLVAVMVVIGMVQYSNLTLKDNVTMVARQCIIKMETDGGMTDETKTLYTTELSSAHVSNIQFHENETDGTTMIGGSYAAVPYGNIITLHVTGNLSIRKCTLEGIRIKITTTTVPIDITLKSTSKC